MRRTSFAALALACGVFVALPAAPASACAGPVCDAVNRVCHCLGR